MLYTQNKIYPEEWVVSSLPGPLWPGEAALNSVLSMGQIELNCVLTLNWIVWNRTAYV